MITFQDNAIVLAAKRLGERQFVVTLLTEVHGLHKGVFRASKSTKSLIEPGTCVQATWKARLSDHLGTWILEPTFSPIAEILSNSLALKGLNAMCSLAMETLPEREKASQVYTSLRHVLQVMAEPDDGDAQKWLRSYCYFELFLLEQTALKLDFSRCAGTGKTDDLIYISPKTGRAVSREAGAPYKDKLLPLPAFLKESKVTGVKLQEILAALGLSGYFLMRYVFNSHDGEMPKARTQLYAALKKNDQSNETAQVA